MNDDLVKRLRDCRNMAVFSPFWWEITTEAADAIEELLAKQTPMKVAEIHVDEYFCPSCGAENNCDQGYVQDAYCPVCGQRLLEEPPKEW